MSAMQTSVTPVPRRFVALRIIAGLCWGIAALCVLGGLVTGIAVVASVRELRDLGGGIPAFFLCWLAGLLAAVFWAAMAEGIFVLLAIEENTRQTATIVRSWGR